MESQKSLETAISVEHITDLEDIEPHPLPENAILLYNLQEEKQQPPKPPPSPKELITECYITVLPTIPENINDIEIPYVRQVGVRDSIGMLAPFFNCNDYQNNLVEFWFLDIMVDFIWRIQDEYSFSNSQQKCVLEWIMFVIKLIINSKMTKELMFQIFNEAMFIAEEYVQAGGPEDPIPRKLFTLNLEHDSGPPGSITSLNASILSELNPRSITKFKPSKQYIVIECNQEYKVFKLPTKPLTTDCLSSSIDSASDDTVVVEEPLPTINIEDSDSSVDFCKVNMATPPRFKSLEELSKPSSTESSCNDSMYNQGSSNTINGNWHNFPRKRSSPVCPSQLVVENISLPVIQEHRNETESSLPHEKLETPTKDEILRAFYEYNIWNLRNEFLNNSKEGWTSLSSDRTGNRSIISETPHHTENLQKSSKEDNQLFIKSGVLLTIRQIVHDYFEHNFAFDLVKISLTSPQFLITQDVNMDWYIPKEFKGDLRKPFPKKPKKEKAKKDVKPKSKKDKSKASKGSKPPKGKGKDKKSKKDKTSKADKKSKATKKSKSSKEDKRKNLSKEEKKELERKKEEDEELEKELQRQAEEKMYMFPLKEAVDDQFFVNIFPNYKSAKKGNGGKKEKSPKSSKDSKDTKQSKTSKKLKQTKKKT